jgi:hypothetical protein
MSPKAVSADTIPNSAVGIFSPKTGGTKTKAARVLMRTLKSNNIVKLITFLRTPQRLNPYRKVQLGWDQANRGQKLGMVWRNRKKMSQIITDYTFTYRSSS